MSQERRCCVAFSNLTSLLSHSICTRSHKGSLSFKRKEHKFHILIVPWLDSGRLYEFAMIVVTYFGECRLLQSEWELGYQLQPPPGDLSYPQTFTCLLCKGIVISDKAGKCYSSSNAEDYISDGRICQISITSSGPWRMGMVGKEKNVGQGVPVKEQ